MNSVVDWYVLYDDYRFNVNALKYAMIVVKL